MLLFCTKIRCYATEGKVHSLVVLSIRNTFTLNGAEGEIDEAT